MLPPKARIPRTRGDGPVVAALRVAAFKDSPHPRGWTPGVDDPLRDAGGFPAPAGMDPGPRRVGAGSRRIPRTRGDGPERTRRGIRRHSDSPHPRGWTADTGAHVGRQGGFPAPAGMDRDPHPDRAIRRRIPRTRGDGPAARPPRSPSARGFPAPAGMDRGHPPPFRPSEGIPRTRGDGPITRARGSSPGWDSPHPRGWTGDASQSASRRPGFPAPAGMDPRTQRTRHGGHRIPRTRGDGPGGGGALGGSGMDSPHPRGWTRQALHPRPVRRGFPAPAGMDRSPRLASSVSSGIPRTRGDGPSRSSAASLLPSDSPHPRGWTLPADGGCGVQGGFPAPAGMDPSGRPARRPRPRIPRTRGDGPSTCFSGGSLNADSPHPRGWTLGERLGRQLVEGFPAPAGMDPASAGARPKLTRIPRTRGDGPPASWGMQGQRWDSPHPRGWTSRTRSGPRAGGGFPAPAGMDPF